MLYWYLVQNEDVTATSSRSPRSLDLLLPFIHVAATSPDKTQSIILANQEIIGLAPKTTIEADTLASLWYPATAYIDGTVTRTRSAAKVSELCSDAFTLTWSAFKNKLRG